MKHLEKIKSDEVFNYNLYSSDYIKNNQKQFILDANEGTKCFEYFFEHSDYTWTFHYYNIFSLTSGSKFYYELFTMLKFIARDYLQTEEPLWTQCWINAHSSDEVLDWHNHSESTCHGYISLDPHKTITKFNDYEIKNEIGQIYIGESHRDHAVIIEELFDKPRITIGYDIYNKEALDRVSSTYGYDKNLSFIPM